MEKLSALDAATVRRQASMSTAEYMSYAIKEIDQEFGQGYAVGHPELVGAFINASAQDFAATIVAQRLETLADNVEGMTLAIRNKNF